MYMPKSSKALLPGHTFIPLLILFLLLSASVGRAAEVGPPPPEAAAGLISGRILTAPGKPFASGRVGFFAVDIGPPSRHGDMRRVPEVLTPIKADGFFSVRLPAGRYYVGAMSRDMSGGPGPPSAEDNALSAVTGKNKPLIIEVTGDTETELEPIIVRPGVKFPDQANYFTVIGTVSDTKGKPFAGAYIFVKVDAHSQRPGFISKKTGRNGRFELKLPAGKSYRLMAKDTVSFGKPAAGKHIGAFNGPDRKFSIIPAPASITGEEGEILTGIDIIMHESPEPEPQKAGKQEKQHAPDKDVPSTEQQPG